MSEMATRQRSSSLVQQLLPDSESGLVHPGSAATSKAHPILTSCCLLYPPRGTSVIQKCCGGHYARLHSYLGYHQRTINVVPLTPAASAFPDPFPTVPLRTLYLAQASPSSQTISSISSLGLHLVLSQTELPSASQGHQPLNHPCHILQVESLSPDHASQTQQAVSTLHCNCFSVASQAA